MACVAQQPRQCPTVYAGEDRNEGGAVLGSQLPIGLCARQPIGLGSSQTRQASPQPNVLHLGSPVEIPPPMLPYQNLAKRLESPIPNRLAPSAAPTAHRLVPVVQVRPGPQQLHPGAQRPRRQ